MYTNGNDNWVVDGVYGRMYLDVVVSRDKSVFKTVDWDDVEDRFIKYVNSPNIFYHKNCIISYIPLF